MSAEILATYKSYKFNTNNYSIFFIYLLEFALNEKIYAIYKLDTQCFHSTAYMLHTSYVAQSCINCVYMFNFNFYDYCID